MEMNGQIHVAICFVPVSLCARVPSDQRGLNGPKSRSGHRKEEEKSVPARFRIPVGKLTARVI